MKNLNLNADFLLDIWADLKAKRLAPVAIGLVVIAVAMPALMLRGGDTAIEGPLPIAAPAAVQGAKVEVAEELADGSKLDSYEARDPFEGASKPAPKPTGDGTASVSKPPSADAAKGPDTALLLFGGGKDKGTPGGSGPGGPNLTPGSDPNLAPDPPVIVKRPGTRFTYQLDLKLGRVGREKRYPSVPRMSFLPSPAMPALNFMGVVENETKALFFVHPGVSHAGEGKCIPSNANCGYLTLKVGQEHFLTAEDFEFHVKLLGIKKVKLSDVKAEREQVRKEMRSRRSGRTTGEGETGAPAAEDFELPLLVDGIG